MAWPEGVPTVEVAWSKGYSAEGARVEVTATVRAVMPGAEYLVHAPTGSRLLPLATVHKASSVGEILQLPAVDAEGWVDDTGAEYNGWSYVVDLRYLQSNKAQTAQHSFQVFSGEPQLDLDEIFPGPVGEPTIVTRFPVKSVGGILPDASGNIPIQDGNSLALQAHIDSLTPHPVYDNVEDLALYFENGLI